MKKYTTILLLLLAITLLAASCKKSKTDIPLTELEKLPPITQTGANTFGCLVDGVAWLPNGSKPQNGGSNINVYVDPTFQGGYLALVEINIKYQTLIFPFPLGIAQTRGLQSFK